MPVLRTLKTYRSRTRGKRFIRLYRAWLNMRNREAGRIQSGNGKPVWEGVGIVPEWSDFMVFRAWALAHGYSKLRCSLDRRRTAEGYGPSNCRWLTVRQNSALAFGSDPFDMGGAPVFAYGAECPF